MDLYDLPEVTAPEPPVGRTGFSDNESFHVRVDRAMLAGDQNRLAHTVVTTTPGANIVNGRFPEPTVRALAVLLDIADKPWYCDPEFIELEMERISGGPRKKTKKGKATVGGSRGGGGDGGSVFEAILGLSGGGGEGGGGATPDDDMSYEQKLARINTRRTFEATDSNGRNHISNRIEVYILPLPDAQNAGVFGWIISFFVHDTKLNIDEGIRLHAALNATKLRRRGGPPCEFWEWETDVVDWIQQAASPYVYMRFTTEKPGDRAQRDDARAAVTYPLYSEKNPARTCAVFSFGNALDGIPEGAVPPNVATVDKYHVNSSYFNTFPAGARWIPPALRKPRGILYGALERPSYIPLNPDPGSAATLMRMAVGASVETRNEDPDELLRIVSESFEDLIKDEEARRDLPECAARFQSWVSSVNAPPGIQACWETARKYVGCEVVPQHVVVIDDSLSNFANTVARFLLVYETEIDCTHLHMMMLYDVINAYGAMRAVRTLRNHTLRPGPSASGKSWEMKILEMLCAPGTVSEVGHQTKRSDNTSTNRDCTLRIMDEANEVLSDKSGDGAGRAEFKQILTSGISKTETCVVETEPKFARRTETTTAYLLVLLLANTNARLSAFPASMISRLMVRYMPERRRKGVVDPALFEFMAIERPSTKRVVKRHQLMHAIGGLVTHAIDVSWLPNVNMSYAIAILHSFLEKLRDRGVVPDPRTKQRLPLFMRALTIWYAVHAVFDSHAHFAPGTLFKIEHLLECKRYLRCSREHVYFAITAMHDTIVNVNAPEVFKAIKKLIETQQDGLKHPRRNAKRDDDRDTSLYLLLLPMVGIREEDLILAAAKMIAGEIGGSSSMVVYSEEMIADTLEWVKTQKCKNGKPAMRVQRSVTNEIGLVFDAELLNKDAVNVVMRALEDSMEDAVRGTDKRFATGMAFLDGIRAEDDVTSEDGTNVFVDTDRMYPHLFRVLDASKIPKTGEDFVMRNPTYKEAWYTNVTGEKTEADQHPYLRLFEDYDNITRSEWLRERGLPDGPDPAPDALSNAAAPASVATAVATDEKAVDEKVEEKKETPAPKSMRLRVRYPYYFADKHMKSFDTNDCRDVGKRVASSNVSETRAIQQSREETSRLLMTSVDESEFGIAM